MKKIKAIKYLLYSILITATSLSYAQSSPTPNDIDGDGVANFEDNCSEKSNSSQLDSDNDGFGNVCDADFDNNNIVNNNDYNIFLIKFSQGDMAADLDGDGYIGFGDIAAFDALHSLPPGPGATEDIPEPALATVSGRVVDIAGLPVTNSTVTPFEDGIALDVATAVDNSGEFSLAIPADASVSLLVSAPSYANQVVVISSPPEDGTVSVRTTLIKRGDVITISENGVNTYTGGVGAAVTFDKADFVDEDGATIVGDIQLSITPVDVSKPATLAAFPGSFSGVTDDDSAPSEIISLGTVEYHFTQNGKPINLAPGKTAEVLLPIYINRYQDGSPIGIGDSIPLWSLNEETGLWLQEGFGEVVASENSTTGFAMKATVSHFSWWNVDLIAESAEVEITVLGQSEGDATIFASTTNLAWRFATIGLSIGGTTDRLRIPANTEVCISAALVYNSGTFSAANRECITANSGQVYAVTLNGRAEGELDVITKPIGPEQDVLEVYTAVNQPVPVSILPLSAETSVVYSVSDGQLPAGLSIQTVGVEAFIVGSPAAAGEYEFTVTATDSDSFTDEVAFRYSVQEAFNAISLSFAQTEHISLSIGLFSGTATINWNDGSTPEVISFDETNGQDYVSGVAYTSVSHTYGSPRAGNITVTFSDGYSAVKALATTGCSSATPCSFNFNVFTLSSLENIQLISLGSYSGPITGVLPSIPRSVEWLYLESRTSNITGDTAELPSGLQRLILRYGNGISGRTASLPRPLNYVSVNSNSAGEISGDLANLPPNLDYFYLNSRNTISGNISSLPSSALRNFYLYGQNTVTGDIADIPAGVLTFYLNGSNTATGNIRDIPASVISFSIYGQNTITGDIGDIPNTLRYLAVGGTNTLTGDIDDIPDELGGFTVHGNSTIYGDIGNLSTNLTTFNVGGSNTILGNVNSIPENVRNFQVSGSNTITGDISELHANIYQFNLSGQNTVSGDLGLLKSNNIGHLALAGNNTVDAFNESPEWTPTSLSYLWLSGGGDSAFDASEVDRLLIHLSENLPKQTGVRSLGVRRTNDASPTSESAAAITNLNEKNYVVYTN